MPYRDGKYVHPDQLPSNEKWDWYERHPHPSSFAYVAKEKRDDRHRELEEMYGPPPEPVYKEWNGSEKQKKLIAKRRALADELNRQIEEGEEPDVYPYFRTKEKLAKQEAKRIREAEEGIEDE
jgi:hypothetical protein